MLTRLPPPHRAPADIVERFLQERFPKPLLALPGEAQRALLGLAVRAGLSGGAVYDALVAATAKRASASLFTRDRRARRRTRPSAYGTSFSREDQRARKEP